MAAADRGGKDLLHEEQVKTLLEAPNDEFQARLGRKIPVGPFADGDLVRAPSTFQDLVNKEHELADSYPALRHSKRVIMGDCQMDVSSRPCGASGGEAELTDDRFLREWDFIRAYGAALMLCLGPWQIVSRLSLTPSIPRSLL